MTAICFVCNLPIMSHQVGLVWQGSNGWDDMVREQLEESVIRQRLGGRRDSSAQAGNSPPSTPPTMAAQRRRRSSLVQITDFFRDWSSGGNTGNSGSGSANKRNQKPPLNRRETLADIARSLPWARSNTSTNTGTGTGGGGGGGGGHETSNNNNNGYMTVYTGQHNHTTMCAGHAPPMRKRRESSADSGIRSMRSRRESHTSEFHRRAAASATAAASGNQWTAREKSPNAENNTDTTTGTGTGTGTSTDVTRSGSRRDSGESNRSGRRDSTAPPAMQQSSTRTSTTAATGKKRRDSLTVADLPNFRQEQRPSTSSTDSGAHQHQNQLFVQAGGGGHVDTGCQALPPPTIIMSSVTPPATSPTAPPKVGRRDSTTQCGRLVQRRDSRASPERPRLQRLQRQATAFDESCLPVAGGGAGGGGGRRGSGPALSPDGDESDRKARRDSLSPDSASRGGRRDSRAHLSPDRSRERDGSPRRKSRLRRQSSSAGRQPRSPDSSSCCSSRDASPCGRPPPPIGSNQRPAIRRQSTTEEILISRGFRRQSTTEEMIRCRNFRRQSSQSDDILRFRGRRDSSAQITDGTIGTMTVETTSTFFDSSTQTEPSPLYENNHYHEECLRCNSCGLNLTGPNQKRARRFKNQILCDLHFADVALMECSDFMQQLRSFKPQSLGCAVARRKSSTTLIFPLPPQACSDEFCYEFPHRLDPTPGYWIECSRNKIDLPHAMNTWEESDSENENIIRGRGRTCFDVHFERGCNDLFEDDEELEQLPMMPKKLTAIEEQWEQQQGFELTSVEQETYEKYFYATEHWNYFTNDEDLGPVILSIKQETLNGRDQFRILVRAISYTVHGLIPASCVFADRYNREEVVRSLGKEVNLNPPLTLGQLPDTPEELLKLDQVFIKSELKVGVIYVKESQHTEEQILDNNENSPLFEEFLQVLGEKNRLRGFDKYKGGLDTVHDLTGLYSVYTNWRGIEIMFHVSTLLPYESHDPQKLQRKRHIGNDIVCVVFIEGGTTFSPACIKSHFLHTFIVVRPEEVAKPAMKKRSACAASGDTSDEDDDGTDVDGGAEPPEDSDDNARGNRAAGSSTGARSKNVRVSTRCKRHPTRYSVSVVTRDEVGAYKPYLWEQCDFEKGPMFREWILTKVVNGERASYSAPKFARMQERTRSQMLEDIVANLANHAETGQIPKPYRRGSWRPIGHMRPSSPLLDSVRDQFEDYDQLAKDFTRVFLNLEPSCLQNAQLFDVVFMVGQSKQKTRFIGVRAILGVRSRVFQEMLYGIQSGFGSPQVPVAELLARPAPTLMSPQSGGAHKGKSSNFLQVPDMESPRPKSVPSSPMVKRAFSRLGTITAGWGRSIRSRQNTQLTSEDKKKWASSHDCSNKDGSKPSDKDKQLAHSGLPRLSVCADAQKVDRTKLAQTEFSIIEFDADTFRILLDYLHTGSCPLTCVTIPGLICAAEHYDLPELLQACFHHAKQFLRVEVVCSMLNSLENYYWRYTSAAELVNMIIIFTESRPHSVFQQDDFLALSESMVQMIMCRELDITEIRKFEAMLKWARNRVEQKAAVSQLNERHEFRSIMDRLTRDLKLQKISPQDLIRVVLPSHAVKNERILETLLLQANLGTYRMHETFISECKQRLQKQDSRCSDWADNVDVGL